jgi:hypothetical protein
MSESKDCAVPPKPWGRLMLLGVSANTTEVHILLLLDSKSIL